MTADPTPEPTGDRIAESRPRSAKRRWLDVLLLLPPPLVLLAVGLATPTAALFPHQGDVQLYFDRAAAIVGGGVPYRDVPLEYPPLAIVPMVVPYAVSTVVRPEFETYRWTFLAWEAALLVALGLTTRRLAAAGALPAGPIALAGRLTLLTIAAALPLAWRYDLFPALLAALAVLAALHHRAAGTGVLVAAGALAKLFPVVILPAVGVRWLARRDVDGLVRVAVAGSIAGLAAFAPFAILAGPAALSFFSYQAARGLQLESIGGGLVLLAGAMRGAPVELVHEFSAVHVSGALADAWLMALPLLTLAGFGLAAVATLRASWAWGGRGEPVPAPVVVALAAAWVLALLVTSKVLSVQYVVWLVPFAALLPRGQLWLAAAICALSMGVHPLTYARLIAQDTGPILLLNVRNALLVVLFGWVLATVLRRSRLAADAARRRATAQ